MWRRRNLRHAVLTRDEETALLSRARNAKGRERERARDRLIESNFRLLFDIAVRYRNGPLSLDDLIQEGAIGLIAAADRCDPAIPYRFSTFAARCITISISDAIGKRGRLVRIPGSARAKLANATKLSQVGARGEIGGQDPDALCGAKRVNSHRVNQIRIASMDPVSLDGPAGMKGSISVGSLLEAGEEADPFGELVKSEVTAELVTLLGRLTPRERKVVEYRTGWSGGRPLSLAQIGAKLRLSRERVRQIEVRALEKLRLKSARLKELAVG